MPTDLFKPEPHVQLSHEGTSGKDQRKEPANNGFSQRDNGFLEVSLSFQPTTTVISLSLYADYNNPDDFVFDCVSFLAERGNAKPRSKDDQRDWLNEILHREMRWGVILL